MSLDIKSEVMLAEYNALRAEILQRLESRDQALLFALAAFGVLLGLGTEFDRILILVAPLVYYPLVIYWSYQDITVCRIGSHIRTNIESQLDGLTWEKELYQSRKGRMKHIPCKKFHKALPYLEKYLLRRHFEFISFFVVAGSMSLAVLLWIAEDFDLRPTSWMLLTMNLGVVPFTLFLIIRRRAILAEIVKADSIAII